MPKKTSEKPGKGEEEKEKKPEKANLSSEEYEKKVTELAKEGLTSEKIGEALRKQGIHPKEHEKKVSKILKEKGIDSNPDLKNMERKLGNLEKHYSKNRQDKRALKDRERIFGKLRKLKAYFSE